MSEVVAQGPGQAGRDDPERAAALAGAVALQRRLKDATQQDPDIARVRKTALDIMLGRAEGLPAGVEVEHVDAGGVAADWIVPQDVEPGRTFLYVHGGGYLFGSAHEVREMVARTAVAARARALAIDYRLAPEHTFPAAHDDCLAAYRWLIDSGAAAPERLAVAGESSGAGLLVATVARMRDDGVALPRAVVLLSPCVDLAATGDSISANAERDPLVTPEALGMFAQLYFPELAADSPQVSPLFGDLAGLPPILIQVGTAECLLDDSTRLARRAREAGVDVELELWPDMVHLWHGYPDLRDGIEAAERVGRYISEHTS